MLSILRSTSSSVGILAGGSFMVAGVLALSTVAIFVEVATEDGAATPSPTVVWSLFRKAAPVSLVMIQSPQIELFTVSSLHLGKLHQAYRV